MMLVKLRAIGFSNFYPDRLIDLAHFARIVPMVNQVETHVFFQQQEARPFMDELNVIHESWGTFLLKARIISLIIPTLKAIAEEHGKTVAQVAFDVIRFNVE